MTVHSLHDVIFWPEAIISAGGLVALPIDLVLAVVLLTAGALLHTALIVSLFVLPSGVDDE